MINIALERCWSIREAKTAWPYTGSFRITYGTSSGVRSLNSFESCGKPGYLSHDLGLEEAGKYLIDQWEGV